MNNALIMEYSVFKIGEVISVNGRTIKVKVDKTKNVSHILFKGELIKNISVGSYIKIIKGFTKIIGKIDGEFVHEDKIGLKDYGNHSDKIYRTLLVSMLGFFNGDKFKRGIKELPLVYDECYLLNSTEFMKVHDFIQSDDEPIEIGRLAFEKEQIISIGVNSLVASHIGIFGNTGSGKSYTLAKIYAALFMKYKNSTGFLENSKFYLFDFNGEYLNSGDGIVDNIIVDNCMKNIYNLSTNSISCNKFPMEQSEVNDVDFWSRFLTATEQTQQPFLRRSLDNPFYLTKFDTDDNFKRYLGTIIKQLIIEKIEKKDILQFLQECSFALNDKLKVNCLIEDYQSNLYWHSKQSNYYYKTDHDKSIYDNDPKFENTVICEKIHSLTSEISNASYFQKIRLRFICQYFYELAKYDLNSEHISPLLKRLKRIDDLEKVVEVKEESSDKIFNVISFKNVNTDMKKVLPLLICKQIYNKQKHNRNPSYLNIIVDEAHNILSHTSERESQTWKDYRLETFEEIIKEGRKFGVFLTIASQRPSDISSTIISQLHNYFLHRLINNKDIEAVEKTISYLDKVSFEYLPILPTGTCIFAGLSAQVPVVLDIGRIDDGYAPKSDTVSLTKLWK